MGLPPDAEQLLELLVDRPHAWSELIARARQVVRERNRRLAVVRGEPVDTAWLAPTSRHVLELDPEDGVLYAEWYTCMDDREMCIIPAGVLRDEPGVMDAWLEPYLDVARAQKQAASGS